MALWIGGEIFAAGGNKVAIQLNPGANGIFEVKVDGKVIFDKGDIGRYPDLDDAKAMRKQIVDTLN